MAEKKIMVLPRTLARLAFLAGLSDQNLQGAVGILRGLDSDGDASHDSMLNHMHEELERATVRQSMFAGILRSCEVIDVKAASQSRVVVLGSRVQLLLDDVKNIFWIGSDVDAKYSGDGSEIALSADGSPIARAIMGRGKGYEGSVEPLNGDKTRFKILELMSPE